MQAEKPANKNQPQTHQHFPSPVSFPFSGDSPARENQNHKNPIPLLLVRRSFSEGGRGAGWVPLRSLGGVRDSRLLTLCRFSQNFLIFIVLLALR